MIVKQLRSAIDDIFTLCNFQKSENVIDLIVGTACVESECGKYIKQINGPACGIFQIEPNTAKDIQNNYIKYRENLKELHNLLYIKKLTLEQNLMYNLAYQIFICRVFYLRIKEPVPNDIKDIANYWKKYYNTYLGKGTVEAFINKKEKLDV